MRRVALAYHSRLSSRYRPLVGVTNPHSAPSSLRPPPVVSSTISTSHRLFESIRMLSPGSGKKREPLSESESDVDNRPVKRVRGDTHSVEGDEENFGLDKKLILEEDGFIVLENKSSVRTMSPASPSRPSGTTGEQSAGEPGTEEDPADKSCDDLDPLKTTNFFRVNIATLR